MSGKDGGGQSAREDTEGAEAVVCGAQHSNCGCEGTFCIFSCWPGGHEFEIRFRIGVGIGCGKATLSFLK